MKTENQILVEDNKQILSFEFRSLQTFRQYFFYFLYVASLGMLYLPFHWFPKLNLLFYDKIDNISECTHVIFFDDVDQIFICRYYEKSTLTNPYRNKKQIRYVELNGINYFFDDDKKQWKNIQSVANNEILEHLCNEQQKVITQKTAEELQNFYGKNSIELKVKSFFSCLLQCFFTPLNTYEILLFYICFLTDSYFFMSLLVFYIFLQTMFDMLFYYQRVNKINQICHVDSYFTILRLVNGSEQKLKVHSEELVIGDTILVQPLETLTCDVIVIEGSCLIDQAVLTGESIPINKTALEKNKIQEINKILSGSKCIILRSKQVKAVVFRTGWNTYKGKLVGKLANQKLKTFKFIKEMGQMMVFSLIFYLTVIALQLYYSSDYMANDWKFNVKIVVELFTSALPTSFFFIISICSNIIAARLKDKQIHTIINSKILECGRVKNICFDKTGTLTENQIKIFGFALMNDDVLEDPMQQMEDFQLFNHYQEFNLLLACCQSLNVINDQVVGDPIEEEMFKMTKFQLKEIQNEQGATENVIEPSTYFKKIFKLEKNQVIKIEKEISFTSERKRMSTIIKNPQDQNNFYVFTKGAPEVMKDQMDIQTVPNDYDQKVKEFSEQGFRLLTIAYKKYEDENQDENEIEKNLIFIGFLLLDNPLKKQSPIIIDKLKRNGIDCAMITGDNIYTGINIGMKSNLIEKEQNIWVGQMGKNKDKIKWIYFNNNEIENLEQQNLQYMHADTISSQTSQIIKSKISRGTTYNGNQHIQKVISDVQMGVAILALEGQVFEKLLNFYDTDQKMKELFLQNTKIYGRAKPSEKKLVIQSLKEYYSKQDYCVGFVGDGSNDAQALQEAHFGLSIGNNDSSLSASFSTQKDNIEPCIDILEEGKMILENFMHVFKLCIFMGFINATCIFLLSITGRKIPELLASINLIFWTPQFLFQSLSKPGKLNKLYPEVSFYQKRYFYSQLLPTIVGFITTILLFYFIMDREEAKYIYDIKHDLKDANYIEPIIFFVLICVTNYAMCVAYNRGYPFKENVSQNYYLMIFGIFVVFYIGFYLFTDFIEDSYIGIFFIRYMSAANLQDDLRIYVIVYIAVQTIVIVCTEKVINTVFLINQFKEAYKKNFMLSLISVDEKNQLNC